MNFLRNHPFAVEAFFNSSLVLTFAVPWEQLQQFVPAPLELETYQDKWAFVAVAMVQTTGLRPKGFPRFMGNDFFLIGYRVFVHYTNAAGKRFRGLYILKSETDKKSMEVLGNIFTHYRYTTTDIRQSAAGNSRMISSAGSGFNVSVCVDGKEVRLPTGSPFSDWQEARRFAGPLPFTFTIDQKNKTILIIEGVRQNWKPQPVRVNTYAFDFFEKMNLENAVLANAFEITNIPYYWKKGRVEKWK